MAWETETGRLVTRVPEAGDLDGYRALMLDPAVEAWLRPPALPRFRDADIREMLSDDEEHWAVHGFGPWAIIEREGGEFVGRGGLKWTSVEGRLEVELPWAIRSDRWGLGYATEVAICAAHWARSLDLDEVVALVIPENLASRRVAEKIGMREGGRTVHSGLPHLVYRMTL
jgi:RimJ/RimL family protein N-acetyltransferase